MQKMLDHTSRLLSSTKDELKQAHYNIKEKDFVISKQIKAGNHWLHMIKITDFTVTFSYDGHIAETALPFGVLFFHIYGHKMNILT